MRYILVVALLLVSCLDYQVTDSGAPSSLGAFERIVNEHAHKLGVTNLQRVGEALPLQDPLFSEEGSYCRVYTTHPDLSETFLVFQRAGSDTSLSNPVIGFTFILNIGTNSVFRILAAIEDVAGLNENYLEEGVPGIIKSYVLSNFHNEGTPQPIAVGGDDEDSSYWVVVYKQDAQHRISIKYPIKTRAAPGEVS